MGSAEEFDDDDVVEEKPKYEFQGPWGALAIMIGLPFVLYALYFGCSADRCDADFETFFFISDGMRYLPELVDPKAAGIFFMWMAGCVLLDRVLPGEETQGVLLKTGKRLAYVLNGHLQFWITFGFLLFGDVRLIPAPEDAEVNEPDRILGFGPLALSQVYDHYLTLLTASVVFSFALSLAVYVQSWYKPAAELADGGQTPNGLYNFFIGRELNPRLWGNFDLKVFCELRPGLLGWAALNLGCAFKQYEKFGYVTVPMVLINAFQGLYVWDALFYERAILTTMDVTTDGFGFMLAFGDLSWVPFTYSLQARYLVDHDPGLDVATILAICCLKTLGYIIFRGANSEKDAFRRNPADPKLAHLKTLHTERGRKLLVSGWWGIARKINYTGDWLMGLSWCLLCGFEHIIPYFYAIYFAVLLVHRAFRDDEMCAEKYGADWKRYKETVQYRFIPFVF